MPEPLTVDVVRHVASLARLDLTEDEVGLFTEQLGAILQHAADIESLNASGVPPTAHPLAVQNVLRDDVIGPCLDRQTVLAEAPAQENGQFQVPRIMGEEA